MKKHLIMLLCVLFSLPAVARDFSYTYNGQTLNYTVIDEDAKTCQVKAGNRVAGNHVTGELEIPSEVSDGEFTYSVTSIGEKAFFWCSDLTSVTIPESVTYIGEDAFVCCDDLTSITIPESVTTISNGVFCGCSNLTSITLPESVTSIGAVAFYDCWSLTSVTIPNGVTSIGNSAFYDCWSLTSVTIPNGVIYIGDGAFYECSSLPSVTIPESVNYIGKDAFRDCTGMTSLTIPGSVNYIGYGAFFNCAGLTSVYYGAKEPISTDSAVFTYSSYDSATLYVPDVAVEKCKLIYPWSFFKNIQAFDFSGIEEISADFDKDTPYEIYTLNGVKIGSSLDGLTPGLYIVRQGKTVKKISVM